MRAPPLLPSILAAIAAGCGDRMETTMCISLDPGAEECPPGEEVDVETMYIPGECGIDALAVRGDATDESMEADGGLQCCYPVLAVDPTPFSDCVVGRPYAEGGETKVAPLAPGSAWGRKAEAAGPLSPELADAWARQALFEHASVASFARLTLSLMAVGAPAELLAAAQEAAADEVRHALDAFALASRFAGRRLGPGRFPIEVVEPDLTLPALAAAALREGAVGEAMGTLLAEESARIATDPEAKAAWERIAVEERRHAALSWQIVAWALRAGGRPARDAALLAMDDVIHFAAMVPEDDPRWRVYGCLGPAATRAVIERGQREVLQPALDQLFGRTALEGASA